MLWDGYANDKRALGPQICIDGASGVLNADGPNKYKNPALMGASMRCTLPRLPAIALPGDGSNDSSIRKATSA